MAGLAFETGAGGGELHRRLANRTHENFEESWIHCHTDPSVRNLANYIKCHAQARPPSGRPAARTEHESMLKSAAGSSGVGMGFAAVLGAAAPVGAQRSPAAAPEAKAEAYSLFLEGLRLEQGGQVPAAIEAHRRALELDTEGAEVAAELSALYARDNRPVEAIRMAEQALKIEATNLEAHRVLGMIYAAQANAGQQFEDGGPPLDTTRARLAASHLEQARSPFAVSPGLELTLGRLYLQMRDYDKAAGVLAEFVDREPGVEEAVLLLSTAHEAAGRPADARAVLEEAVAFDPGFLRGVVALAQLLDRNEEWATAAEAYGRAAALNPSDGTLVTRPAA